MFSNLISKKFKIAYFLSSFTIAYIPSLLIISLVYSGLINTHVSTVLALVFIVLFVISVLSLFYVKLKISEDRKRVRINSKEVYLQNQNYIFWRSSKPLSLLFLLAFPTILLSTNLLLSLGWVLSIQLIAGYYFYVSAKFLLNIPLLMTGEVLLIAKDNTENLLLFMSRKDLKRDLGSKINYIPLGETSEFRLGIYAMERWYSLYCNKKGVKNWQRQVKNIT